MKRLVRCRAPWLPERLTIAIAALQLASNCGCSGPAAKAPDLPAPAVTVAPVVELETIDYDEFVGRTEASETVEVRSRVYGYLQEIKFQDGDDIEQGQPLFLIEPDEYNAIHEQAKAKVAVAKSKSGVAKTKHARNEKLIKTGSVSREEFDETAASVVEADAIITAAQADEARSQLDVDYTQIMSPIDGRIDRTFVTRGNFVTGGQVGGTLLTRIVKNRPMYVYFDADELSLLRYLRRNKPDAGADVSALRERKIPCYLQLADETGFPHAGVLDFAENRVDAGTGTIRLRGVLANEDRQLTGGMFVRVRVPVSDSYQALLIPERAIATDQGKKYVYVVDDASKAVRRDVTLGVLQGSQRIVRSGLAAGERVIVAGQQRVRPDQTVEPKTEPPADASALAPPASTPEPVALPVAAHANENLVPQEPVAEQEVAESSPPSSVEPPAANPDPAAAEGATKVESPAAGDKPVEVLKPAATEPKKRKREF